MKKLLILGSIATMLISCEGNTNFEYMIRNESSSPVTVSYIFSMTGDSTSFEIPNGSTKSIEAFDLRGGRSEANDISSHLQEFYIINSSNDTCQKDESIDANWKIGIDHVSKVPSAYGHEYLFTVDDSNF